MAPRSSTHAGALVDSSPEEAKRTAKHAARTLGTESFGSVVLSTVAGYVDTAGFLALYGLFTAHVTGDLITAAATVATGPHLGAWVKLAMIPVFMLTVALMTLFARAIHRRGAATVAPLLGLMTLALALFCAAGHFLMPYARNANAWGVAAIGGAGVVAMGIQNALMRGALRSFSQTTLMTGNLTQVTIDVVEVLFPTERAARREAVRNVRKSGIPLLGFMAGAALGAWLTKRYGLLSIALPTVVVAILALVAVARSSRR